MVKVVAGLGFAGMGSALGATHIGFGLMNSYHSLSGNRATGGFA